MRVVSWPHLIFSLTVVAMGVTALVLAAWRAYRTYEDGRRAPAVPQRSQPVRRMPPPPPTPAYGFSIRRAQNSGETAAKVIAAMIPDPWGHGEPPLAVTRWGVGSK